jgi:hypothetical protein
MWLTHRNRRCVELDERVFERLLTFYPEEELLSRPVLAEALARGEIKKTDLIAEADKHFIPWQMFLLTWANLGKHLRRIEKERLDKIQIGELSKRAGAKGPPPYRLIDRYIRAQNFLVGNGTYKANPFNNALRGKTVEDAVSEIERRFGIDRAVFWGKSQKEKALEYLIARFEAGQINVALGTSEARLVPSTKNHRTLYKNISGFCLKSPKVPFAFVHMNMTDEEEPAGRRIYTLVLLIALIGLGIYTVSRDWRPGRTRASGGTGYSPTAHAIASMFLLPSSAVDRYRSRKITPEVVKEISDFYKLTPTAAIYRLWKDKVITREEMDALRGPSVLKKGRARSPHIENAVRKLNGGLVVSAVNGAYAAKSITQNQAQYVLFGRVRRKLWRNYRVRVGI